MHSLSLVLFLTLAAGSDRTVPVGCREDFETCREDCTIDYGGSTTKYRQLNQCIQRCDREQSECTTRHYSLRDTGYDMPERDGEAPASRPETPRDGVRRGVYRATEPEPAAEAKPAAETEPAVMKEPEPEPEPEAKAEPEAKPEPEPEPRTAPRSKTKSEVKKASAKSGSMRIFGEGEPEAEVEAAPEAEAEPEPAPAPKPAPKRVEPPRPKPPPEPKKKDISDWDPNEH